MPWHPEFEEAIKNENIEKIKTLMDDGEDPNALRDEDSHSPLSFAILFKPGPVVMAILKHDKFKYSEGTGVAVLVTVIAEHPEFLPIILKKRSPTDCSVDDWNFEGKTTLWHAEDKGFTEAVALLKAHGAAATPTRIPSAELRRTGQLLGSGSFGIIKLAHWNEMKVAVKEFFNNNNAVYSEAKILSSLKHPHITAFLGVENIPSGANLVMEYMDNRDLEEYLANNPRNKPADYSTVFRFIFEIAQALAYLHEQRIIHLDVKAKNILLNQQLTAKLCDLGSASKLSVKDDFLDVTFEDNVRRVTLAHDILLLGAVLNLVATQDRSREFPIIFHPYDALQLLLDTAGKSLPPPSADTPTKVLNLIRWCTKENPSERPPATQVVEELRPFI